MDINEIKKNIEEYQLKGDVEDLIVYLEDLRENLDTDTYVREFLKKELYDIYYDLACDFFGDIEYEQAQDYGLKALKIDDTSYELKKLLGNIFFENYEYGEALKYYLECLEYFPNDPETLRNIGITYLEYGDYEKSKSYLEKVINIDPNDSLTFAKLGEIALEMDNYGSAIKYYKKSLAKSEYQFSYNWSNLGYSYLCRYFYLMGSSREDILKDLLYKAEKCYQKCFKSEDWVKKSNENFDIWFEYAQVLFYSGNYELAREVFLKAKKIDPTTWLECEGNDFLSSIDGDKRIKKNLISNIKKKKKRRKKYMYYCRKCKKLYPAHTSFQTTLKGKKLCPKHNCQLEIYKDLRNYKR